MVLGETRNHIHAGPALPAGTSGAAAASRKGRLKNRDKRAREVEVPGGRIATLSAAVLRPHARQRALQPHRREPANAHAASVGWSAVVVAISTSRRDGCSCSTEVGSHTFHQGRTRAL